MPRNFRAGMNCGNDVTDGSVFGVSLQPHRRTPDHPPYSEMVNVALRVLAEENGSSESSISTYIQSTFHGLPWGHDRLLPYYLRKLVVAGELTSPFPDRYKPDLQSSFKSFSSSPIGRRGRARPQTSNPVPRFNPLFSFPSRSRHGRSRSGRPRGRPRKILLEEAPALCPGQGALAIQGTDSPSNDLGQTIRLLRRGRGRPRVQRDNTNGRGRSCKMLAMGDPTLDVGKPAPDLRQGAEHAIIVLDTEQDNPLLDLGHDAPMLLGPGQAKLALNPGHGLPQGNTDTMNCSLRNFVFCDDIKDGGSDKGLLEGSVHFKLSQELHGDRQPSVAPEHSEPCNEHILPEEPPLLIPEQLNFVDHEHRQHVEQLLQGEEQPSVVLKQIELSKDESLPEGILPLSIPDPKKVQPFSFTELCEHGHGHSIQGDALPFVALENMELVQDQSSSMSRRQPFVTSKQEKLSSFLAPENFELHHAIFLAAQSEALPQSQGEAPTSMPPELAELSLMQLSIESPLLSLEKLVHNNGLSLEAPDQHQDRLLGVGIMDSKEGDVELGQRSDKEEGKNLALSNKKRKSREKANRHRLWFEA